MRLHNTEAQTVPIYVLTASLDEDALSDCDEDAMNPRFVRDYLRLLLFTLNVTGISGTLKKQISLITKLRLHIPLPADLLLKMP